MLGDYIRQIYTIDNIFICLLINFIIKFLSQLRSKELQRDQARKPYEYWKNIVSHLLLVIKVNFKFQQFQSDICHYRMI